MPDSRPSTVYKIADAAEFAAAQRAGSYSGAAIDIADGFVHFSTALQLAETLRLHFRGRSGLVLAAVRAADLGAALRWEPSRGGELFPHLYGPLPMSAVAWNEGIDVDDDGNCALPDRLG
jgi:uncharacterized protein (DUF952 family)